MKMGSKACLFLAAALAVGLMAGCGDFWQAPNTSTTTGFSLSNSGNIAVTSGSSNTDTITVTPGSSFTGIVTLTCAVTSRPAGDTSATDPTCSFSSSSLTFSSTTAQTSTLTATAGTTNGAYQLTVTGVSGSVAMTTTFCVAVGTTTSSCTSATSGNFYVLNQTTNQIVALHIVSGQVTSLGAISSPTVDPLAIAVAPNGKFLYVSTTTGIYLYTINTNGSLTLGNGGSTITSEQAITMQVDSTNSWLVEAASGTNQLYAINVNSSGTSIGLPVSGTSKQLFTPGLSAITPVQLVISPGDSSSCASCYVFVAMGPGGTEAIHFNPSNTNPFGTSGNPGVVNTLSADNAVAVDPTNRLLYIGETDDITTGTQSGGLRVFTIGNTGITSIAAPYATGGTGPTAIQPSADGNYVYVANGAVSGSSTGNITSFSVTTTALTSIGTIAAGPSGKLGLAEDSTHSYLLAVDVAGTPDLQAYTMSSGTLASALTSTTGSDPVGAVAIAAAP
jgi:6-phosphogluconolactonase (cycloisomerase 2 family)